MRSSTKTTLQELIKQQGYTQKQVAKRVGMKPITFCRMVKKDERELQLGIIEQIVQAIGLKISITIDREV